MKKSSVRTLGMPPAALAVVALLLPAPVGADVSPASVSLTLQPGESATIEKTVGVPAVPPKLDLCLVVDNSGSYFDDLPNIKTKAPDLFDAIRAQVADSQFCLGTFVDYPYFPWGSDTAGDYAHRLNQSLTADKTTWVTAVNAMVTRSGVDEPESQYESLFQMATGAGRDVGAPGASLGDIAAGQNPSFRADANKVIAITTDASFHTSGDSSCTSPAPCPFPYPGPTRDDAVNALVAAGIKVIAIKAPGSGAEMDDVAAATGGAVVTTGNTSEEIADAILAGLAAIKRDITATPVGCAPLAISYVPVSYPDVTGPATVVFQETIQVPASVAPGTSISCSVEFKADETVIGIQQITVQVPLPGRMTGGGSFAGNIRHGFTLNCGYSTTGGENLEVNWPRNAFHLESLSTVACFDTGLDAGHPDAGFDTLQGSGVGRLNGIAGYKAEWKFTDAGEPGFNDTAHIVITDPDGNVVLNAGGNLRRGNHQAHKD
jgi:ribosomal protein S11